MNGNRKYLTIQERTEFLKAAEDMPREIRTFCMTLAYTGCRISEALALTADRIDMKEGVIVFETLKKRKDGVYRAVPVPPVLLDALDLVHGVRETQKRKGRGKNQYLWPWARSTAWMKVKAVMDDAGIKGIQATPKGLRHSFGINAVQKKIPLNLVQKWLGHAQLQTTAIYANAVGEEERNIAERMWD
jgi:integrase